jgi:transcriptional regulator with XRE-family HTH domain
VDRVETDDRLAELVQVRRRLLRLTQSELAERAGVTQTYISNLERGRTQLPKVQVRRQLAQALRMSHVDLLIAAGELEQHELPGSADSVRPVVVGMAAQLDVLPSETRRALEHVIDDLHRLHLMTCAPAKRSTAGTTPIPESGETTPAG